MKVNINARPTEININPQIPAIEFMGGTLQNNCPRAKIWVQHEGRKIAFAYPVIKTKHGWSYERCWNEITGRGLQPTNGDQIASLLDALTLEGMIAEIDLARIVNPAQISEELDTILAPEILELMQRGFGNPFPLGEQPRRPPLLLFNMNYWTDKGVYVLQDSALGKTPEPLTRELESVLADGQEIKGVRFSKDRMVRFAPKESFLIDYHHNKGRHEGAYWTSGYRDSEKCAKPVGERHRHPLQDDGFVIATFGPDGAKKLARSASHIVLIDCYEMYTSYDCGSTYTLKKPAWTATRIVFGRGLISIDAKNNPSSLSECSTFGMLE